jgi:hypothetical protein
MRKVQSRAWGEKRGGTELFAAEPRSTGEGGSASLSPSTGGVSTYAVAGCGVSLGPGRAAEIRQQEEFAFARFSEFEGGCGIGQLEQWPALTCMRQERPAWASGAPISAVSSNKAADWNMRCIRVRE